MTHMELLTAMFNISALVLNGVLLIAALLSRSLKQKVLRWFFYIVLFNMLGLLCEISISFLEGTPGMGIRITAHILDFLSYAFAGLCVYAFASFLYEYLSTKLVVPRFILRIFAVLAAVIIITALVAQFTNLYNRFDEQNYYQQQPGFWIAQVLLMFAFLTCSVVTLRYIRVLTPREWIPLLLYPIAPLICFTIEMQYAELWIGHVGSTLTMLLMYITLHVEMQTQLAQRETELLQTQVSVMLSQIQPHFLYNSLGAIKDLCRRDAAQAEQAVHDFARYLRRNLDSLARKEPISFSQELEHVKIYLSLEQKRFEERLQVEYDIQGDGFALPALTLLTLVENAVTHGITEREAGGTVIIHTSEEADCWRLTVEDDGVGFENVLPTEAERSHTGLENARRRLELCGGTLAVQSTPNVGTVAVITIPK